MRSVSSSRDVHGIRYVDERKRIQKAKRVAEAKKKEAVTSTEYYESRGMTKENKERNSSMTPQEAFRRQIAQSQNSKIYAKLQNNEVKEKEKNKQENIIETEEQEPEL